MPEYTDWVQLDGFRTRQRQRLVPMFSDAISDTHSSATTGFHSGPTDDDHYIAEVFRPALDLTQIKDDGVIASRRAARAMLKTWWDTPRPDPILPRDLYEMAAELWGSTSSLIDWDPIAWEAEAHAAALAEFDADPPPGVTFRYLEWETNPFAVQPWGTYANRMVEFDLDSQRTQEFDRDAVPINDNTDDVIAFHFSLLAVPASAVEDPAGNYSYDSDDESWTSGTLESVTTGHSLGDFVPPGDGPGGNPEGVYLANFWTGGEIEIDDAWWESEAWPLTRIGGSYTTRGMPLVFGPWDAVGTETAPGADTTDLTNGLVQKHHIYTTYANVHFESDWTPPPYRIVYTTTPVAPVLRHYPRRGDGKGWGGVTRGYPPNPSRRGYGGARQP
jgi:hypothetical protein